MTWKLPLLALLCPLSRSPELASELCEHVHPCAILHVHETLCLELGMQVLVKAITYALQVLSMLGKQWGKIPGEEGRVQPDTLPGDSGHS